MRTITRTKAIAATPADYDGTGRAQPDYRYRHALWNVYADGFQIGTYQEQRFSPTIEARQAGRQRFTHYGTWGRVKAKLEARAQ